jgi:hypothetical protein
MNKAQPRDLQNREFQERFCVEPFMTNQRTDQKRNRSEKKTIASRKLASGLALGRRLGLGNRRWWRRFTAPPNERTAASEQRLVRPVLGHCSLPTNSHVITEICGYHALRSRSDRRCDALFYRGKDCLDCRKPCALVVKIEMRDRVLVASGVQHSGYSGEGEHRFRWQAERRFRREGEQQSERSDAGMVTVE